MGILGWIVLGLIAGAIAKALVPGDDPGGVVVTTVLGVVGALVGGFVAAAIFDVHPIDTFFSVSTWVTAIIGSVVLLVLYRVATGRRHARR